MIGITGTPGCGKTAAAETLRRMGYPVLDLKTTVKEYVEYHDDDCGSDVVDGEAWAKNFKPVEGFVEGAFAHYLPCDKIIVLRCRPDVLQQRLAPRGYPAEKVRENVEAEALDIILSETVEDFEPEQIYEIDTTCINTDSVAEQILAFADGKLPAAFGSLDWSEYLEKI